MAAIQLQRRPLLNRTTQSVNNGPFKPHDYGVSAKRARSPAPDAPIKRLRSVPTAPDPEKIRRHDDRKDMEKEFRKKYKEGFPTWTFHFDMSHLDAQLVSSLKQQVRQLGGVIEDFFSANITHLITDEPEARNKENERRIIPKTAPHALGSPIQLRPVSLREKAIQYGQKIWDSSKLDSVTSRCLLTPPKKSQSLVPPVLPFRNNPGRAQTLPKPSLKHLLDHEKRNGTSERDPSQKRHDYRYFSKSSVFVLIEDIRQELHTLAAFEYPPIKDKEKPGKTPWPALHCHPFSRNPFAPPDEKDKKRWEKTQQTKKQEEEDKAERRKKEGQWKLASLKGRTETFQMKKGRVDLRRTVSMVNMQRQHGGIIDPPICQEKPLTGTRGETDEDTEMTAKASGFLQSNTGKAHIAASGNSVTITSATGTTSTTGQLLRSNQSFAMQDKRHVYTTLRLGRGGQPQDENMAPPPNLPPRILALKKSKSTNTMKLPKRDEGAKPGYCENCRAKFDDFQEHITSKKHRKFASCAENFTAIDTLLGRLRRRPMNDAFSESRVGGQLLFKSAGHPQRGSSQLSHRDDVFL